MMIEPGITELDKYVDSRYTLVAMAAKRARMIGKERLASNAENGEKPYDATLDKPVSQAVKEIAKGVVGYVRSEAIEKAREYELEKMNAISQLEREPKDETAETAEPAEPEETAAVAAETEDDVDTDGVSAIDMALAAALKANEAAGDDNSEF